MSAFGVALGFGEWPKLGRVADGLIHIGWNGRSRANCEQGRRDDRVPVMSIDAVILRSGLHLSRGDTLEIRPEALVLKGRHFYDRTVRYENIADFEIGEYRGRDPVFPGVPEFIMLSFTFSVVPEFTGLQKRSPTVPDAYYLSDALMFNMPCRDEVLAAVLIIEERRKSSDPSIVDCRYVFHDRSLQIVPR